MRPESGRLAAGPPRPSGAPGGTGRWLNRQHTGGVPALPVGLEDQRVVPQTDIARDATNPLRSWALIPEREDQVCRNLPVAAHGSSV